MTMRYGWKEAAYPQLVNPLYSNWYWDWEAMGRMYDSMAGRNPYTLAGFEVDFLAHDWTVGTYVDPDDGVTKSMVNVQLRTDIFWSDGVPMDANDVAYTFVGLSADLEAKNATKVWWQPTIDQMKSFEMINPYTVTIKMKVLSTFAIGWVLGNIIVPKHAIQPFVTNPGTTALDISANWFPDHPELLVCTGPMVLVSNDATTTLLTRNPYCYNRSHPADLNYDHTIDIFDVVRVALAFGSVPGDPNWDPKADINYDNIVDIFDLATVAVSFGWIGY
jgi:ABC-type transport system substrate-binding protein